MFGTEVSLVGNHRVAIYPKNVWKLVNWNNRVIDIARDGLSRSVGIATMPFHDPIRAKHAVLALTNTNVVTRTRSEYEISVERREEIISYILMAALTNGRLKNLQCRYIDIKASTKEAEQNNIEQELKLIAG